MPPSSAVALLFPWKYRAYKRSLGGAFLKGTVLRYTLKYVCVPVGADGTDFSFLYAYTAVGAVEAYLCL